MTMVDRAFCSGIVEDEGDRHILRAIVSMASAMDVAVVAEGVETSSGALAAPPRIALVQGYAFGAREAADALGVSTSTVRRWADTAASMCPRAAATGASRLRARRLATEAATTTKPVRNTALDATRRLVTHADLAGASLLERHAFLERYGDAVVRTLQDRGASRAELVGARRVFARLRRVTLEETDVRAAT